MKCVEGCPMGIVDSLADSRPTGRIVVVRGVRLEICSRCGDVLPAVKRWRRAERAGPDSRRGAKPFPKVHMRQQGYDQETEVDWPK